VSCDSWIAAWEFGYFLPAELALEVARLVGSGHSFPTHLPAVSDRHYKTKFVRSKQNQYKLNVNDINKDTGTV